MSESKKPDRRKGTYDTAPGRAERIPDHLYVHVNTDNMRARIEILDGPLKDLVTDQGVTVSLVAHKPQAETQRAPRRNFRN